MYLGNDIDTALRNHGGRRPGVVEHHPDITNRDISDHKILDSLHVAAADGRFGNIMPARSHAQLHPFDGKVGHIEPEEYQYYYISVPLGVFYYLQESPGRKGGFHAKVCAFGYQFRRWCQQPSCHRYSRHRRYAGCDLHSDTFCAFLF